jgi:hypothetical protein
MSAHNLLQQLFVAEYEVADPGSGVPIVVDRQFQTMALTIAASASETNTLRAPRRAGLEIAIIAKTVGGGGSRTITVKDLAGSSDEINKDGDSTLVFDSVDEWAVLRSFPVGSGLYEWRVVASEGVTGGAALDVQIDDLVVNGTLTAGSNTTDRVAIKGFYMNPSAVAVAVPTIANDTAENADSVAVDVSGAFAIQPAVGDAVIAIPTGALPTDCLLCGAYVSGTDTITVSFASKEGGGGVTGANVNFNFLVVDLT